MRTRPLQTPVRRRGISSPIVSTESRSWATRLEATELASSRFEFEKVPTGGTALRNAAPQAYNYPLTLPSCPARPDPVVRLTILRFSGAVTNRAVAAEPHTEESTPMRTRPLQTPVRRRGISSPIVSTGNEICASRLKAHNPHQAPSDSRSSPQAGLPYVTPHRKPTTTHSPYQALGPVPIQSSV
jgi:hypothetical protein